VHAERELDRSVTTEITADSADPPATKCASYTSEAVGLKEG